MSAPSITSIPKPRSPYKARKTGNFELNSWLFMRGSGLLLVVLVFGHLFVNLMVGKGVHAIDFAFVAGKWANPFWQVWDLADAVARRAARHERPAHDHQRLRDQGHHAVRR